MPQPNFRLPPPRKIVSDPESEAASQRLKKLSDEMYKKNVARYNARKGKK